MAPADAVGIAVLAAQAAWLVHLIRRWSEGRPWPPPHPGRPVLAVNPLELAAFGFLALVALGAAGEMPPAAAVAATAAVALVLHGAVFRRMFRPAEGLPRRLLYGVGVLMAVYPLVIGIKALAGLAGFPEDQEAVRRFTEGEDRGALAVGALLVAPVLEEMTFRGLFYPLLRRLWGPAAAIALTSVSFGLLHDTVGAKAAITVLGAAFAFLVERTGSLAPCIAAHVVFNGVTLAAAWFTS